MGKQTHEEHKQAVWQALGFFPPRLHSETDSIRNQTVPTWSALVPSGLERSNPGEAVGDRLVASD